MHFGESDEFVPQLGIFDVFPLSAFPTRDPVLQERVDDISRIAVHVNDAGFFEPFNERASEA